jgi:hypothetical protein
MARSLPSKNGLRIKFWDEIGGTEAMRQANLSYADLITEGACNGLNDTGPESDSKCHALVDREGNIASAIWWKVYNDGKLAWIVQAWTDKKYRRQRFNSILFKAVCAKAKRIGCASITGNIHASNKAMIAAAKKQGRVPTFTKYELEF